MKRFVLRLVGALFVIGVVAAAMAIAPAIPTADKEYEIADPDVTIRLQEDGSLIVREALPFDFTGTFSGAYRDIPLLDGVRITGAQVRDAVEGAYRLSTGGRTAEVVVGQEEVDAGAVVEVTWADGESSRVARAPSEAEAEAVTRAPSRETQR